MQQLLPSESQDLEEELFTFSVKEEAEKMDTRGKIVELLGKGVRPIQVAVVLGVSPSLVSQVLAEPGVREGVSSALLEANLAQAVRDQKLNALEDKCIQAVEDSMKLYSGVLKPTESLNMLKIVNGLVRRSPQLPAGLGSVEEAGSKTVVLQLPEHMHNSVVQIQVNTSNEIVEVNGREMRTMPTGGVLKELELFEEEQVLQLEEDNQLFASSIQVPGKNRVVNALKLPSTMIGVAREGSSSCRKLLIVDSSSVVDTGERGD
jgi:predicted transcriptional regulator